MSPEPSRDETSASSGVWGLRIPSFSGFGVLFFLVIGFGALGASGLRAIQGCHLKNDNSREPVVAC